MKGNTFNLGLVSAVVILTLAPATQAFPPWMKPRHVEEVKNAPRQYNAYDSPPTQYGGYYTYPGVGPQPTIATTPASISFATSESSGEESSSTVVSSRELFSHCFED